MGNTINSSTVLNNTVLNDGTYSWPIRILGGPDASNPVVITFSSDISLQGINKKFLIRGDNIVFDGSVAGSKFNKHKINIINTLNYPGLISNGSYDPINNIYIPGFSNIKIKNLIVQSVSSELSEGSGWLTQSYYCNGSGSGTGSNTIDDCECYGDLTENKCGGILGSYSGSSDGAVSISNCLYVGNIIGNDCGGIVGYGSSSNYTPIVRLPEVIIRNCHYVGDIVGEGSGGIFGGSCAGFCFNSYSIGNVSGASSGGIAGRNFGFDAIISGQENLSIINFSYFKGSVTSNQSGGICAPGTAQLVQIFNCYVNGLIPNLNSIIAQPGSASISDCYSAITIWSDVTATNTLKSGPIYNNKNKLVNPIGTDWIDVDSQFSDIPWILSSYTKSYYLNSDNGEIFEAIYPGASTTIPALSGSGITYQIVSIGKYGTPEVPEKFPTITINSLNGIITTSPKTRVGKYQVYVYYQNVNTLSYSVSIFNLEVKKLGIINPISDCDNSFCKKSCH